MTRRIRFLEELALRALPALETEALDGWLLRYSNGYTARGNSVSPLYRGSGATEAKINIVERRYRTRGLRPMFRLTTASRPRALNDHLRARGYELHDPVSIQTRPLRGTFGGGETVELTTELDEWMGAFAAVRPRAARHRETAHAMLARVDLPSALAVIRAAEPVAVGRAVLEEGHLGIFDMATEADSRRRGHGRAIACRLLDWGLNHGAHSAYLLVAADNEPACHLYADLGFREEYRYWYRAGPL